MRCAGWSTRRVREEILYREALALGLDQGDAIVKRRLAQKMEFLAGDVSALRDPTADELRAWYANNAERFAEPGRRSFRHVYFSTDRRGDAGARGRHARAAPSSPANRPMRRSSATIGDPFMFQDHYADRSPGADRLDIRKRVRCRGRSGSTRILARAHRVGPGLASRVRYVRRRPGAFPRYDEIEPQIKAAWIDEQRAAARQRAFEAMKAHYEIRLPKRRVLRPLRGDADAKSTP